MLIEILAAIGVLKPQRYDRPIKGRNDWVFVEYWRGEDGYDADKVAELFVRLFVAPVFTGGTDVAH